MDIATALEHLNGFFDCLNMSGMLSDEEFDLMNEVEDTICAYVRENERKAE